MRASFSHEGLRVYQYALKFYAEIDPVVSGWDPRHAVADHLQRAAESVVESIATASATYEKAKGSTLDYGLGSVLEIAACLDIAQIKSLVDRDTVECFKEKLSTVFRMLFGLRSSWSEDTVREDWPDYRAGLTAADSSFHFHHETLDVYRIALDAMRWLCVPGTTDGLSPKQFRRLDTTMTSMILNIAEGNGRFSDSDRGRFLKVAHLAAIKTAAQIDLATAAGLLDAHVGAVGKNVLSRVAAMTAVMMRGRKKDGYRTI